MTLLKLLSLWCALLSIVPISEFTTENCTLNLKVQNINEATGNIMVAIFEGAENFLKDDKAIASKVALVEKKGALNLTFPNLPKGTYSVAVYHDVNDNKKLDTNLFGVPTEPYGFSNNARSKWGAPKYKVARFELNEPEKNMTIDVKKWSKQ